MKRMQPTQFINAYLNASCLKLDLVLNYSELRKINIMKIDAMRKLTSWQQL